MSTRCYDTDLNDAAWAWIAPYLPAARSGGRPRTTDLRAVLNAIFYLLRTGCQWRLLPREFPRPGTVYHYFRAWKDAGVLAELQRALHEQARLSRGRLPCPSVVIKRRQRAFKVLGLTWIVERTFAWLGRNRRLSKDYELKVQTSEAFIDLAAIRLMLKRLAPR
jgi:putative transposase